MNQHPHAHMHRHREKQKDEKTGYQQNIEDQLVRSNLRQHHNLLSSLFKSTLMLFSQSDKGPKPPNSIGILLNKNYPNIN
uniref:Uncharacterized protein n=1 Tax=Rhizophora mucronata TaxID=61149 RepID=A0A2P2NYX0_RHIMU